MISATAQRTSLLLVRHGETADNAAHTPRGQGQGSLTDLGWAQARAVGTRLAGWHFDHLYCSDLNRAVQTAAAIGDLSGHEPIREACLRERDFGQFEGIPWAEIERRYPVELARYRRGDPDYVLPDGESPRQLHERAVTCLEAIAERHVGSTIVVVTHGGVIHSFVRAVLDIPLHAPRRFAAANASLSLFERKTEDWTLIFFGDVSHLAVGPR